MAQTKISRIEPRDPYFGINEEGGGGGGSPPSFFGPPGIGGGGKLEGGGPGGGGGIRAPPFLISIFSYLSSLIYFFSPLTSKFNSSMIYYKFSLSRSPPPTLALLIISFNKFLLANPNPLVSFNCFSRDFIFFA